jgi:hypothetical protein
MTRTSIYLRVDFDRHRRLTTYAQESGLTINDTCVRLLDQLLAQVSPGFRWPPWLVAAVAEGHLPHLQGHGDDDSYHAEDMKRATSSKMLRAV